ncbi:potassium-transporting ATPase subunit KdpC [Acidocella aromatica]|uniref:Potassium-transporting ATPase KdpC subunit n=1 Tax=Acidocella aromatica TaxID=1303579 RepID=A0A840V7V9_9PROT|nr:potassium-transporting ATPase subunit KdpC [Acidocella aromatica]MBB5371836.1 K+-transporting ATPase ATPase C chain [Acidocella aromatica]
MLILRELRPALSLVVLFTLILGLALPEAFTGAMQAALPWQANGSLITKNGQVIGSAIIGQNFTGANYFAPRPSALGTAYDASTSGASNLGPTSAALLATVQQRVAAYTKAFGPGPVPADAVTASGSGLDPDISVANALRQAPAVAAARHLPTQAVADLVNKMRHHATFRIIGTDHVNVLRLNLALDALPAT